MNNWHPIAENSPPEPSPPVRSAVELRGLIDEGAAVADIAKRKAIYRRVDEIVLGAIAGISLVVGGIGLLSVMLISIRERLFEIGLRKALGARKVDIMAQMLTESVVLSVFGGVIGTMFGAGIATTIAAFTPIPASVEVWSVALGIGITALVGLFFGLYPASRAAQLDPIEALRRE